MLAKNVLEVITHCNMNEKIFLILSQKKKIHIII